MDPNRPWRKEIEVDMARRQTAGSSAGSDACAAIAGSTCESTSLFLSLSLSLVEEKELRADFLMSFVSVLVLAVVTPAQATACLNMFPFNETIRTNVRV